MTTQPLYFGEHHNQEDGDENILTGIETQEAWGFAWSRAVARAWTDKDFKEKLLNSETSAEAMLYFNYKLPRGLKLVVEEYTGEDSYEYQTDLKLNKGKNGWRKFEDELAPTMNMILPPAPKAEHQAFALADYEAAGRAYPFSTT